MLNKLNELRKGKEEGFTLIELLVVILIIGVLSAIALPIFLNQQKEATNASVKSDVRNTVTQVSTYLVTNPNASDLVAAKTGANGTQSGVTAFKLVVSGENAIETTGGYTNWKVIGASPDASFTYTFDSQTGQYE